MVVGIVLVVLCLAAGVFLFKRQRGRNMTASETEVFQLKKAFILFELAIFDYIYI